MGLNLEVYGIWLFCYVLYHDNMISIKCILIFSFPFSDDCRYTTGRDCKNGACLNSQCHCNDGYGGKGCDMPDDNECKYRPCDVFAYCTNTLGSYFCSCREGYRGDGHKCTDIDECANPALASKCVENAECCNLPAHYVCKCKSGFEGDGEVECRGKTKTHAKTKLIRPKTQQDHSYKPFDLRYHFPAKKNKRELFSGFWWNGSKVAHFAV